MLTIKLWRMAKDGLWEGLDLVEMYKVIYMNFIIVAAMLKVYKHGMC